MENGISFETPQDSFIEVTGELYQMNSILNREATLIINISHIVAVRKDKDKACFYLINGLRIRTQRQYYEVEQTLIGKCNFIGTV
ncbi:MULTISPECIES: hypothetical protein [Bacteroides]|jgi:hypothetical protein|uniref:hypothetical protein n=1 Tax=Bacteroides TaxID=816 RepID=UPI000E474CF8|nr:MULTISPECIES: hypothetical protein [Bacteroides]RHL08672.1 hypothetical protein DW036_12230 [Bacteroides sp. AF39-11AC]